MRIADLLYDSEARDYAPAAIFGVAAAVVTNNQDPDGLGRVKLRFPWLSDEDESNWARVAALMAGKDRGAFFLPEIDDEVLVAFEHGDVRLPYVVGALWNGQDAPPATNGDGKNNVRVIKSRSGHVIRLNDEDGKETVEIVDKSQKNSIAIDTANNTITITSDKDIVLKAANGTITLDAQKIALKSSADTAVEASGGMNLNSSGTMTVKGATVNIN